MLHEFHIPFDNVDDNSCSVVSLGGTLDPQLILNKRRPYYKEIFYDCAKFQEIKARILNGESVFIVGNPLSGKSRIIFEALKEFKTGRVIIPQFSENILKYNITIHVNDIFLFDEFDSHLKNNPEAIKNLIRFLVKTDVQIIVACRVGPEYLSILNSIDKKLLDFLRDIQIRIPRFSKTNNQINEFHDKFKLTNLLSDFDGNIGSLILPLREMRDRYLEIVAKEEQLQEAILMGLKFHYNLFNYESRKNYYDEGKIRIFCERYLGYTPLHVDWNNAKRALSSSETGLNFIEHKYFIEIEEAYLECHTDFSKDVIAEELNIHEIHRIFNQMYKTTAENEVFGFPVNINTWNQILFKQECFNSAFEIFEKLPETAEPNRATYTILLKKSEDKPTAIYYYEILKKRYKITNVINSVFFGKFNDFFELYDAIEKFNVYHISKLTNVSKRLIKLSKTNPEQCLEFLFSKNSVSVVFKNSVLIEICSACSSSTFDLISKIKEFFGKTSVMGTTERGTLQKFTRLCAKLKLYDICVSVVDLYFTDNYFFANYIKALAIQELQPINSLNRLSDIIDDSLDLADLVEVCTQYCALVYERQINSKLTDAIKYCENLIFRKKISHEQYPQIRYLYILLIIQRTSLTDLTFKIKQLLNTKKIWKSMFLRIFDQIKNDSKKDVIKVFFSIKQK